jgi:tetratricopeptide (TPR) repeat protein
MLLMAAGLCSPAAIAANATLSFLEQRVAADPLDNVAQARLSLEYINAMRASGDLAYLQRAEQAARASLESVPAARNPGAVIALAAALYESHRFKEALQLAKQAVSIDPRNPVAALLIGDAQFELGDYAAAEQTYGKLAGGRAADHVAARMARLAEVHGKTDAAVAMLSQLVDTPDDSLRLRVRLQLSELQFARGDFKQARLHLEAAQRLQPDSYAVEEHLAELQAAEGRFADAEKLYRKVLARVPRPEFMQALGDLYQLMERPEDARQWRERAKTTYLQSTQAGNAHFYHHLTSFFCDSDPDPAQALHWAREDLNVRDSVFAYDGLAWALYKNSQYQAAAEAMDRALAAGTQSAHLLFHASAIYGNAGRVALGRKLMQQALAVNPRYNTFHVHR